MEDKLKVFLSSAQKEFERPRKILERNISQKPFLICELLEKSGALPTNVVDAAIKEVRESNIYIGIFGKEYSETTKKEYEEAYKKVKPIFIYVKNINLKKREPKLNELLDKVIKPNFKMHYFKKNQELYSVICKNLEDFIYDLLKDGLKIYKINQQKLIKEEKRVSNISQHKSMEEILLCC